MRTGSLLAFVLLVLVALAHLARLVYSTEITVDGTQIPQWVSVGGLVLTSLIAFLLWRESKT